MSNLENLVIDVDIDTKEKPFPVGVEEGAYFHVTIDGLKVMAPVRAFTFPPMLERETHEGTPQRLSTLPSEIRDRVLNALKRPEAIRRNIDPRWTQY